MLGLRESADLRTLGFLIFHFSLTIYTWRMHDALSFGLLTLLWPVIAFSSFQGAVATHNTMHCAIFKSEVRWANKLIQVILTLSYGHPVSTYVPGHNLSHHRYTQLRKDAMRTSKLQFRWHFLNGLLFQPIVARDVLYNDIRYTLLQYRLGRPFFKQAYREFIVLIVLQVVLAVLNWRKFLIYIYFPHFFAQWAIVSINLLQHDGCDGTSNGPNCARNFTGKMLNFLMMNNGYHTIHHIKPWLHWSYLPEAHAKEVHPVIHPELEQTSMLSYIWQTFVWPGERLTYEGKPLVFDQVTDEDWVADFYPKDPDERQRIEKMTGTRNETFGSLLCALFASMLISAGSLFGPDA